jgi:hypothetical protein
MTVTDRNPAPVTPRLSALNAVSYSGGSARQANSRRRRERSLQAAFGVRRAGAGSPAPARRLPLIALAGGAAGLPWSLRV